MEISSAGGPPIPVYERVFRYSVIAPYILEELIELFADKLPEKAKVAVLPSAGIQVLAQEE